MSEQKIQASIIKYLESNGAYVVKVITASKKGVPDILVCYKGKFIGIEVKRPETKTNVSPLQSYNLKKIEDAGGLSYVLWDINQIKELLNSSII